MSAPVQDNAGGEELYDDESDWVKFVFGQRFFFWNDETDQHCVALPEGCSVREVEDVGTEEGDDAEEMAGDFEKNYSRLQDTGDFVGEEGDAAFSTPAKGPKPADDEDGAHLPELTPSAKDGTDSAYLAMYGDNGNELRRRILIGLGKLWELRLSSRKMGLKSIIVAPGSSLHGVHAKQTRQGKAILVFVEPFLCAIRDEYARLREGGPDANLVANVGGPEALRDAFAALAPILGERGELCPPGHRPGTFEGGLLEAVMQNNLLRVVEFLVAGSNPSALKMPGDGRADTRTAMHLAANPILKKPMAKQSKKELQQHAESIVDLLLAVGAEVDTANDEGVTPLMTASSKGHASIVDRLLRSGADPARRDAKDMTPAAKAKRAKAEQAFDKVDFDPTIELLTAWTAALEDFERRIRNFYRVQGFDPTAFKRVGMDELRLKLDEYYALYTPAEYKGEVSKAKNATPGFIIGETYGEDPGCVKKIDFVSNKYFDRQRDLEALLVGKFGVGLHPEVAAPTYYRTCAVTFYCKQSELEDQLAAKYGVGLAGCRAPTSWELQDKWVTPGHVEAVRRMRSLTGRQRLLSTSTTQAIRTGAYPEQSPDKAKPSVDATAAEIAAWKRARPVYKPPAVWESFRAHYDVPGKEERKFDFLVAHTRKSEQTATAEALKKKGAECWYVKSGGMGAEDVADETPSMRDQEEAVSQSRAVLLCLADGCMKNEFFRNVAHWAKLYDCTLIACADPEMTKGAIIKRKFDPEIELQRAPDDLKWLFDDTVKEMLPKHHIICNRQAASIISILKRGGISTEL